MERISAGISQEAIGEKVGMSQSAVGRWKMSSPKPEGVAAFARAFNRPVLEAFVAAGFLTDEDARLTQVPADLTAVESDLLLEEIRRRLAR